MCRLNCTLHNKEKGKERKLHTKAVTMIDHVTGWFEIVNYDDKIEITIENSVEIMCLSRSPITVEITYDQGKEFIDPEVRKSLIEKEYGITANPCTSRNYYFSP